jgi:hypothetical protein
MALTNLTNTPAIDAKLADFSLTLAEALSYTNLIVGQTVRISDRGDGLFDVVLTSGVTNDLYLYIQSTAIPTLTLQLRIINRTLELAHLGIVSEQEYGGGGFDNSSRMQYAMDSPYDLNGPDGTFQVSEVTLSVGKSITLAQGFKFKPFGQSGAFVFKVDGSGGSFENSSIFNFNRIYIDGGSRQFPHDALLLKGTKQSEMGDVTIERIKGTGVDFLNSVKETHFSSIKLIDCGSTTSSTVYKAGLDLRETLTTGDAHNQIFIDNFYSIYSRGPDIVIDSAATRTTDPRKIYINKFMIHGHIEASDPAGMPLTAAEKNDRVQLLVGSCQTIVFGTGSIQFAALAAPSVHKTVGANSAYRAAGKLVFDNLSMNDRFDFASGSPTQFDGMVIEAGQVYIKGIDIGPGYVGHDAVRAETGSDCYLNPLDTQVFTGAINIVDTNEIFSKGVNWNFEAKALRNMGSIVGSNSVLNIKEGQSGSEKTAMQVRYGVNTGLARVAFPTIIQQSGISLPTAATMISDGIGAAIGSDGTNLRWFDGTTWKTVTTT